VYTLADVALHNTLSDCWVALYGFVYNITPYVQGGGHPISFDGLCGQDVTAVFIANHINPVQAAAMLEPYRIGILA
jgi:cytochrome b involved in lipid metabolism